MKKKVMNIRPQEVTEGGERSVRYKGSDGQMHEVSANLPSNAVIPIAQQVIIAAGETITLAQAHEIEDFDFNKVSALNLNNGYNPMTAIYVNHNATLGQRFLEMAVSGGASQIKYKIVDDLYVAYSGTGMNRMFEDTNTGYALNKSRLKTMLLQIAKQTGKLEIQLQNPNTPEGTPLERIYEDVIELTLAEDYCVEENIYVTTPGGKTVQIATVQENNDDIPEGTPSNGDSSANIVLEVNFADAGKTFTADELIAIVTGLLAGKGLVCISDNNWGTQNERRIAYLTRVNGFEIVDGNITIGNTLKFEFANSTFGDLDSIYFLKQQDGSYQLSHYFNK